MAKLPLKSPTVILMILIRTGALVAVLSAAAYLGIMEIADRWAETGAQYWLTLVLLIPAQLIFGKHLYDALKQGEFPVRLQVISRHEKPFSYWSAVAWSATTQLLLFALTLYALGSSFISNK